MRTCSVTGEEIHEGWHDEEATNGQSYFKNKIDVVKHIREIMSQDVEFTHEAKEATTARVLEIGYNFYSIYWTTFED